MHSFTWNGKSSLDYGIMIEKDPDKNRPAKKYSVSNIQGRNGNYYQNQGTFEEVTRKYNIFCSLSNSGKIDIRDRNINVNKNNPVFTSLLVDIDNNARMGANAYANVDFIAEDGSEISKTVTYPNSVFEDLEGGVPKGTFDFMSGTLTATHLYVSFEDLTFSRAGVSHHYRAGITPYFDVSTEPFEDSWADATTPYTYRGYGKPDEHINKTYSILAVGSTVFIDVYDEDIEDPSELIRTTYSVIVPLSASRTYQCNTVDIELSAGKYRITGDNPLSITTETIPQNELITEIMEWLYEPDGYAELSDTYDPDHYREAVLVDATPVRDLFQMYGRAEVTFRCRPERFLSNYKEINPEFEQITGTMQEATFENPTAHISKPLIKIDNSGNIPTLLNPTGATEITSWTSGGIIFPDIKNPHFYVGLLFDYPTITIDSSKINSYSFSNGNLTINSNTYRYGIGINTPVLPNTVYTFSTNMAQPESIITLMFCDSNGIITDYRGIGLGTEIEWTFKTHNNTRYIVFYFDNRGTNPSQYNSLMLNTGETKLPFYFSNDTFTTYVQINDTIVSINDYFGTAFIDCESYDVRTPDVSLNQSVVLTKQMYNYTESSTAFPTIISGENHIYTPIDSNLSYTIKTRIWEI